MSIPREFRNTPENFIEGKTSQCIDNWRKITNDKWILQTISGYEVELENVPKQNSVPKPLSVTDSEQHMINTEIKRFLDAKIVEKIYKADEGGYISNIFFCPKKDGKIRIILNLKTFNENHMDKLHFKMESLQSAISVMRKNCYFGSVDLSEAFYSVPIKESDRIFFRFGTTTKNTN